MIYDGSFVDDLPDDPVLAIQEAVRHFEEFNGIVAPGGAHQAIHLCSYITAFAVLERLVKKHDIQDIRLVDLAAVKPKDVVLNVQNSYKKAREWLSKGTVAEILKREQTRYDAILWAGVYEFPEADYARIQVIINKLRDLIVASEEIPDAHKDRLLKALEQFQAALHKRTSDIEGHIGRALGLWAMFRDDLLDAADWAHELVVILWRGKAKKDLLPPGTAAPMLPAPEED